MSSTRLELDHEAKDWPWDRIREFLAKMEEAERSMGQFAAQVHREQNRINWPRGFGG